MCFCNLCFGGHSYAVIHVQAEYRAGAEGLAPASSYGHHSEAESLTFYEACLHVLCCCSHWPAASLGRLSQSTGLTDDFGGQPEISPATSIPRPVKLDFEGISPAPASSGAALVWHAAVQQLMRGSCTNHGPRPGVDPSTVQDSAWTAVAPKSGGAVFSYQPHAGQRSRDPVKVSEL